jgi:tetratricopeptide (TPR) repeat protein
MTSIDSALVAEPRSVERSKSAFAAALLLAVVLALVYGVFGRVLEGSFVYDDLRLIARNPRVIGTVDLWESLTTSHWGFDDPSAEGAVGYWRPLTVLVLRIAYWVGGGKPLALHLFSLALHIGATFAAWAFFARLFSNGRLGFFAALLFGLHPVHVESVAWISALNDPLAGMFVFLSLAAFLRWRERGGRGAPFAAAGWLLLGALAKEQALAAVPMLLVLDFFAPPAPAAPARARFGAWLPVFVALLLYWLARVFVFGDLLAGIDRVSTHFQMTLARALSFRLELFGGFLWLLAFPLRLEVFRPFRPVLPPLDPVFYLGAFVTLLFVCASLWAWKRRQDRLLALLLLIPASLAPVLASVAAAGLFPFSDRYLYVGAAAAAGILVWLAFAKLPDAIATASVVLVASLFALRVITRAPVWHDEDALFRAAAAESPRSPYVQWGLGRVLLLEYQRSRDQTLLQESLLHFLTSLTLGSDYGDRAPKLPDDAPLAARVAELERAVHDTPSEMIRGDPTVWVSLDDRLQANLGQGWCYLGLADLDPDPNYDVPLIIFEQQTKHFPQSYEAWTALGSVRVARGEIDEALQAFGKALSLNPAFPEAWANQARAYVVKEDWTSARASFEKALQFEPGRQDYVLEIARTAIEGGHYDVAEQYLARARASDPDGLQPVYLSGVLAAARGEWSDALARFDQVITRQKDHGLAHLQKGKVLLRLERTTEAIRELVSACELLPSSFEAYYDLGRILQEGDRPKDAVDYLLKAYQLAPRGQYRDDVALRLAPSIQGDLPRARALAQLSRSREDWNAVLLWLHLVLIEEPEWAEGHYLRGQALSRLGRAVEAQSSLEHALELAPDHFRSHLDLGMMLAQDQPAVALPHLRRANELLETPAVLESVEPTFRQAVKEQLARLISSCEASGAKGESH